MFCNVICSVDRPVVTVSVESAQAGTQPGALLSRCDDFAGRRASDFAVISPSVSSAAPAGNSSAICPLPGPRPVVRTAPGWIQ